MRGELAVVLWPVRHDANLALNKCDAIQPGEINGAHFPLLRDFKRDPDVGRAFELFDDPSHGVADRQGGPFALTAFPDDAAEDVVAFEPFELLLARRCA